MKNILADIPARLPEELFQTLAEARGVTIERIVSRGHASPGEFWYDQERDEFVLLVRGQARLLFEGEKEAVTLSAGDFLTIPAHCRHRVEWTAPDEETVWLAIHY